MNHKLSQLRVGDTLISKKELTLDEEVKVRIGDKAICIDTSYNGNMHLFLFEKGDVLFCKPKSISKHFKSSPIGFISKFATVKFKGDGTTARKYEAGFFDEVWSRTGANYLKLKHNV